MKKILFVDDSKTFSAMMTSALSMGGYSVCACGTFAEVSPLAKSFKPDLIILDMVLPDGTGLGALKVLKADEATKAIPVVLLTAREDPAEIGQVLSLGGLAHLLKYKTTPKFLLEKTREWLK
ncbi:MAG: response regulator [Elusimicrobiota bacterium]